MVWLHYFEERSFNILRYNKTKQISRIGGYVSNRDNEIDNKSY